MKVVLSVLCFELFVDAFVLKTENKKENEKALTKRRMKKPMSSSDSKGSSPSYLALLGLCPLQL